MTTTFFCIETGNSLYGGTVRHFFNSPAAVMSFLKATREGWSLRAAEWDDGELVPTRPITNCQFIDEDGGIDAVLERLEAAARTLTSGNGYGRYSSTSTFGAARGWRRLSSLSVFFSRGILSGRIGNSLNR